MVYPKVNVEEWAKTYNLAIPNASCQKCGRAQSFVTPFAHGKFRGLIADHGDCGEEYRQSIFVSVDKQERVALGEFVRRFAKCDHPNICTEDGMTMVCANCGVIQ